MKRLSNWQNDKSIFNFGYWNVIKIKIDLKMPEKTDSLEIFSWQFIFCLLCLWGLLLNLFGLKIIPDEKNLHEFVLPIRNKKRWKRPGIIYI